MRTIDTMAAEVYQVNFNNGWDVVVPDDWDSSGDENKIPAKIALAHSELSEALEAYRAGDKQNFAEELADTIIRILDIAEGLGLSMMEEITKKTEKNRTRGWKHGGKRV